MAPGMKRGSAANSSFARTSMSAGRCGTPIRRASLSANMVLNDDMMMRPWRETGAILQLSPHGEIASPYSNHNTDRPVPVNRLRSTTSAVLMAMVKVGVMRMPVPKPLMPVPMRMRLDDRAFMAVLMMFVVDVPVFVLDHLVRMVMAVSFGQVKPEAERHKHAGAEQLSRHRFAEQHDRDDRAEEWREREISAGSGAAEMAQRQHKQHQTDPDPKHPDEERCARRTGRRQAGAEKQRQSEVHASSHKALDQGDDHRVGRRKSARQVVVDAPCEARRSDQQAAFVDTYSLPSPGEHDRAREDRSRAEQQPPIDVLAEDDPRNGHGGQSFEVQQERTRRGGSPRESEHQEQRSDDAPEHDDRGQRGRVSSSQGRFRSPEAKRRPARLADRRPTPAPR